MLHEPFLLITCFFIIHVVINYSNLLYGRFPFLEHASTQIMSWLTRPCVLGKFEFRIIVNVLLTFLSEWNYIADKSYELLIIVIRMMSNSTIQLTMLHLLPSTEDHEWFSWAIIFLNDTNKIYIINRKWMMLMYVFWKSYHSLFRSSGFISMHSYQKLL